MTSAAMPASAAPGETPAIRAAGLVREGRGAEAIALLRDEAGEAATADAWEGLAELLWGQGDFPGAEAACREILALAPRHDNALIRLSVLMEWRGQRDEAKAMLRGDGAAPLSGPVAARIGFFRVGEHDFVNAETVLRFAIQQPGAPPGAWRDLSDTLIHLRRRPEALVIARQGVDRFPGDPVLQAWLGHLLIDGGHYEEALGYLDLALASGAAPAYARMRYAEALFRADRPAECMEHARMALADDAAPPPAMLAHIGYLLVRCGAQEEGDALLRRAIASLPDSADLRLLHSAAFFDSQRIAEALAAAREATEAMPGNADVLDRYGHMLLAVNDPETACAMFERAIAAGPHHLRAWVGLCEAERQCRRFKNAIAAFRKLPELGADAETIRTQRYRLFGELT